MYEQVLNIRDFFHCINPTFMIIGLFVYIAIICLCIPLNGFNIGQCEG